MENTALPFTLLKKKIVLGLFKNLHSSVGILEQDMPTYIFVCYRMLSHKKCREQYNKHTVLMFLFFSIIPSLAGLLERISEIPITFYQVSKR